MSARKPRKIHELQGTLQPCRTNKNEPIPQQDIIKMQIPSDLTQGAKDLWQFAVEAMPRDLVTTLDAGVFTRWCMLFDNYMVLSKSLNDMGVLVYDEDGNAKLNPIQNTLIKLSAELRGIELQLGFTPAARTKVSTTTSKEEDKNSFLDL